MKLKETLTGVGVVTLTAFELLSGHGNSSAQPLLSPTSTPEFLPTPTPFPGIETPEY